MRLSTFSLLGALTLGAYWLGGHTASPPMTPPTSPVALIDTTAAKKSIPTAAVPLPAPQSESQTKVTAPHPSQPKDIRPKQRKTNPQQVERAVLTAAAIAALIVAASRSSYHSTGRPCACPDDTMRNGRRCGARSAYSRPGGAAPLCYPGDVTKAMIQEYKSRQAAR